MFGGVFASTDTFLTLASPPAPPSPLLDTLAQIWISCLLNEDGCEARMQIGSAHHLHLFTYERGERGSPLPALNEAPLLCSKSVN